MMLYKLSFRNIKKSFKDYAIYFFTLVLGVAIFYVFNSIESQTVLLNVSESTHEIIKLMNSMLSGVGIFVSVILGGLIIYASRFLMKRRNKEFGIYMTLGMSKKKISKILLLETILIGIISLIVGLTVGIALSQIMSIFVANMFEADMTKYEFIFSKSALINTIIYFGIMYLLVIILNVIQVGRCKLIELLQASKKSEKVKMKNPYICVITFIVASIMLGYAYYLVTAGVERITSAASIFLPITLGAISTFLIFWSLSGLILKIVMSIKKTYYKGLNSFTLRQMSSKINTTVLSVTVISLMLFVTICVFSSALSIKNSMTSDLKDIVPTDIQIYKTWNISSYNYTEGQVNDSKISVHETLNKLEFDIDKYFKEIVDINLYATKEFTYKESLGSYLEQAKKQFPQLNYDAQETIVRISDYNKLARLYKKETYQLKENEYIIIADFKTMKKVRNEILKKQESIYLLGHTLQPKYNECQDGFIFLSPNYANQGIFIVPDDVVDESIKKENVLTANYKADNKQERGKIDDIILSIRNHPYAQNTTISASPKNLIYESSIGLSALVTFIGLYIGIIFLISSAAVLALKELSESTDNKERFRMLRKLGTDEKMINQALFRQIAIFFLFPLIIAIIHSIFGIRFCTYILATFGEDQLLNSIIMTASFLILIYGGYFLLTYLSSKNIIKDKH